MSCQASPAGASYFELRFKICNNIKQQPFEVQQLKFSYKITNGLNKVNKFNYKISSFKSRLVSSHHLMYTRRGRVFSPDENDEDINAMLLI